MPNERRIKALKLRQKSLLTSFNLIKTFVDDYDETTQASEISVRLESLMQLWTDYNNNQKELEMLDDDALDEHLRERVVLETSYYRVKGFLLAQNKSPLCLTPHLKLILRAKSLPRHRKCDYPTLNFRCLMDP